VYVNATEIDDRLKKELDVQNNLFGEQFITDLRPVAGKSAAKSGKLFENIIHSKIVGKGRIINKRPKFKCHFGLDREGDFEIITNDRKIHIECKQLGNCESHFDKLSHVFMNLVHGCYGDEMWLVYDYNGQISSRGKRYIHALVERCKQLKKQVALQGITFELVLVDNIKDSMNKIDIIR
jgi:hypothetical protein|tara:strand:- start:402 stop:941 length:540 start_codon:yes stop_codon:yes gene_type:complete